MATLHKDRHAAAEDRVQVGDPALGVAQPARAQVAADELARARLDLRVLDVGHRAADDVVGCVLDEDRHALVARREQVREWLAALFAHELVALRQICLANLAPRVGDEALRREEEDAVNLTEVN